MCYKHSQDKAFTSLTHHNIRANVQYAQFDRQILKEQRSQQILRISEGLGICCAVRAFCLVV